MKYRILKINSNEAETDATYFVQKKKLFGGWHTIDYFSSERSALLCLMKYNPNFMHDQFRVIYEE